MSGKILQPRGMGGQGQRKAGSPSLDGAGRRRTSKNQGKGRGCALRVKGEITARAHAGMCGRG